MRGVARFKRLSTLLRRLLKQTIDPNFIGFDKYKRHGAYHWQMLESDEDYRSKLSVLKRVVCAQDSCLDLGCGDAAYMYALSPQCRSVIGVDADYDAVRVAHQQLAKHGAANCRCVQMPLSKVTLPALNREDKFSLVYSMDVLEHLPNPRQLLEVATAMVTRDGLVVVGTPLYIRDDLVSSYHVKEFTRPELHALLSQYLALNEELVLPQRRNDGKVYPEGFYIGVGALA